MHEKKIGYKKNNLPGPFCNKPNQLIPKDNGKIIWLFGRPSSGKTTIAKALKAELNDLNKSCITLDGDELRAGLNKDLGFSPEDRRENFRRAVEMAKLLSLKGYNVVCSFITPTKNDRDMVKVLTVGFDIELVYVYASLQTCINRDVKGLYKKAISGEISNFTGITAPFDEPEDNYIINTEKDSVSDAVRKLLELQNILSLKAVNY